MSGFSERYGPWGVVAGASTGLGAAFARALAERGVNVLAIARRADALDELQRSLTDAFPVEVRVVALDLAATDAPERFAAATANMEIGLGIYNAAFAPLGDFDELGLATLLQVVDVNVRGPLVMAHSLVPAMTTRKRGGLVFMSSLAGAQGTPRLATYAASKAFNTVLGEGLWHELRPRGIDVVACCAGAIRTPGYTQASSGEAPGTLDANEVAEATLHALGRGPRLVPGLTNRVANGILGLLPRRVAVGIMARQTGKLS